MLLLWLPASISDATPPRSIVPVVARNTIGCMPCALTVTLSAMVIVVPATTHVITPFTASCMHGAPPPVSIVVSCAKVTAPVGGMLVGKHVRSIADEPKHVVFGAASGASPIGIGASGASPVT